MPVARRSLAICVLPDVITSLELERMMNAAGPTSGKIRRLSDGAVPDTIVFIQCVGSRDITVNRPYCSCVCCMQAIKNAILIKEKNPETDIIICYMDIRSYGKGYEEYYERAKALGVRFLRGMPSDVLADRNGMTLQVENSETAEVQVLHPDLVVLSVGIGPAEKTGRLQNGSVSRSKTRGSSNPCMMLLIRLQRCAPGSTLQAPPPHRETYQTALHPEDRQQCGHIWMQSGRGQGERDCYPLVGYSDGKHPLY